MPSNKSSLNTDESTQRKKVSCLMVTANRLHLARRAIQCFKNQSYKNKELVILDDGSQDYSPLLNDIPSSEIKYIQLDGSNNYVLGQLRNLSLEAATGDYLIQWDDDDWYHPERVEIQASILDKGFDVCCLSSAIMHLDTPEFIEHPYIGILPDGIPGSIMHKRNDDIRYPETRRAEDTVYLKQWMEKKYFKLENSYNYLFLRAYHGQNTWEQVHFKRRIRNSVVSFFQYVWYKHLRNDLFSHPRFKLSENAKDAFDQYWQESKELKLF